MIIRGTPPDYAAAIALFTVATGRFISEFDESHTRPVVMIGNAIADSLFPHSDPIGKKVRMNSKLYEVIGSRSPIPASSWIFRNRVTGAMSLLTGVISSIGLLVGGIV